jgi:hypothetical protein
MRSPVLQNQRMYLCKQFSFNTAGIMFQKDFGYGKPASIRPFVFHDDEADNTDLQMWAAAGSPDTPWAADLGSSARVPWALAWDGSNKKCYVIVNSASTADSPPQRLYVCDEHFSTATLLQSSWGTRDDPPNDPDYIGVQMVHFKDGANEGLVVYSISFDTTKQNRYLEWFNLAGEGSSVTGDYSTKTYSFRQVISSSVHEREDILFLSRGASDGTMQGGVFATVLDHQFNGSLAVNEVTYTIEVPFTLQTLSSANYDPTSDTTWTFYGQGCFDELNDRILFPELVVEYDSGDESFTVVNSRIRQITKDAPGDWTAANTTVSTLFDLPTETSASNIFGVDMPEVHPQAVWTNELDGGVYVWLKQIVTGDPTSGLHGFVRYEPDGSDGRIIFCDEDHTTAGDGLYARFGDQAGAALLFGFGDYLVFGPGSRAPWEI